MSAVEGSGVEFFPSRHAFENVKCVLVAQTFGTPLVARSRAEDVPALPAIRDGARVVFGANLVCAYLACRATPGERIPLAALNLLEADDRAMHSARLHGDTSEASAVLAQYEALLRSPPLSAPLLGAVSALMSVSILELASVSKSILEELGESAPLACRAALTLGSSSEYAAARAMTFSGASSRALVVPDPLPVAEVREEDGALGMLRAIFTNAIRRAFPLAIPLELDAAVIARCGNAAHGDYQCNNAMALTKALKGTPGYSGPASPRETGLLIEKALQYPNPLVESTSTAPNGFINITISRAAVLAMVQRVLLEGTRNVTVVTPRKVLVDFSSPNIAKEMHVGHLRSTIIGDAVCRILEFVGHDVRRVNHVGDWGTQFGMLISYLQDAYPNILTEPPNISDLTVIYKASKKRFDEEPAFKERARSNVVNLQSGDAACRAIWTLLCDISRLEFQKVYDLLGVSLEEVGESFYNSMIPRTIEELTREGYVIDEEGMLIIKLPHFEIPLIARKSDGGYGYDSTDLSAIRYRLLELQRDWLIYITDEGQGNHFRMCFDVARAIGWADSATRLDHVGFGVVCGDDGKRLKTRSAEGNVRLIDLLEESRTRMYATLQERNKEGRNAMSEEELDHAARVIGYGAVKYFDLKQHPATNYIFSFDRMLDTKGDTAVYLLFAYARVTSILSKAEEQKGISIEAIKEKSFAAADFSRIDLRHPAERALIFEIFQFPDMIRSVLADLLPNRLCDYLKEVSVKFTDFVTKCHVLNSKEDVGPEQAEMTMYSRLLLCEASRRIMETCFQLLGIGTLSRI